MKLFEVTNGFMGYNYVRCLVIASSEAEAIQLAHASFFSQGAAERQDAEYWERLEAKCLCDDVTQPWAGKVTD